jgi:hypothetical protein
MKRKKHHQNTLPLFYKIYNVSAVKMHQLSQHIGECVRSIFTEKIPELDLLLHTTARKKSMKNQKRKYQRKLMN